MGTSAYLSILQKHSHPGGWLVFVEMEGVAYKFSLAVARETRRPPLAVPPAGGTSLRSSTPPRGQAVGRLSPHTKRPLAGAFLLCVWRWRELNPRLKDWTIRAYTRRTGLRQKKVLHFHLFPGGTNDLEKAIPSFITPPIGPGKGNRPRRCP